jgi:hypothetical protein
VVSGLQLLGGFWHDPSGCGTSSGRQHLPVTVCRAGGQLSTIVKHAPVTGLMCEPAGQHAPV